MTPAQSIAALLGGILCLIVGGMFLGLAIHYLSK